jgi:hypothetical protein
MPRTKKSAKKVVKKTSGKKVVKKARAKKVVKKAPAKRKVVRRSPPQVAPVPPAHLPPPPPVPVVGDVPVQPPTV